MWVRTVEEKQGAGSPRPWGGKRPDARTAASAVPQLSRSVGDSGEAQASKVPAESHSEVVGTRPSEITVEFLNNWFVNYADAYAVEIPGGWTVKREVLTAEHLRQHLAGEITVGVFPIMPTADTCKWICFDIDTLDPAPMVQLMGVLKPPYVVEHTGGRGRHIWQFFVAAVNAGDALAYGQRILGLAGVKAEVYPKQSSTAGGLGNLLRLPFGKNLKTGEWSRLEHGEFKRTALPVVPRVDPRQPHTPVHGESWLSELFDGDAPNGRNNGLNRLAYWMLSKGFPKEVVDVAVRAANESFSEPLPDDELDRTVLRERRGL